MYIVSGNEISHIGKLSFSHTDQPYIQGCNLVWVYEAHLTQRQLSPSAPAGRRTPWRFPSEGTLQVDRGTALIQSNQSHQSQPQKKRPNAFLFTSFHLIFSWKKKTKQHLCFFFTSLCCSQFVCSTLCHVTHLTVDDENPCWISGGLAGHIHTHTHTLVSNLSHTYAESARYQTQETEIKTKSVYLHKTVVLLK